MIAVARRGLNIGLAAILAILLFCGGASYWNTRRLHEESAQVTRTDEVVDAFGELLTLMTSAETGQRGYLLTSNERYLEPYDDVQNTVPNRIDSIQRLTVDNPRQQQRIPHLRELVGAKLAEMQRTVELTRERKTADALAIVNGDEGRQLMEEIRQLLTEMGQDERDLLAQHRQINQQAYVIAALTGPASAVLGAVSVVAYFLLLRRHQRSRERAAAAVYEQRELLQATLVSIGDGVIATDGNGQVTLLNNVAQSLTGWAQDNALGRPLTQIFNIVNEVTRQNVQNPALRALQEGIVLGLANHTILISRDGVERPIDDSAAPVRTTTGKITGAVLVFRDITERKRVERQLARLLTLESERSQRLRRVAQASLTLNAATSMASVLGIVQAEARHIIGAERSEVVPEGKANGSSALSAPINGRDGRVIGYVRLEGKSLGEFNEDDEAVLHQLANIAAVAIENARLYEQLREADGRKDEFLAVLAHELRNPLAPIGNALQILRMTGVNTEIAAQARGMMERQLHQLKRLVDDLLDVSRITQNKLVLRQERIELALVLRQAVEVCRPLAEGAGQEITISPPDEPLFVMADPMRLTQVFSNLLNNACKYSEAGRRVQLLVAREGGEAVVRVRDSGIGIPAEMLSKIFDMFAQVDNSLEKSRGGLGIGLTLVKRLVQMHGGAVEAHSEGVGTGSEFVVRLPLNAAPANLVSTAARDAAAYANYPTLRVLVVDDNRDSADSLMMLLKLKGHEVRTAHDGPAALIVAEEFRPNLVVLDIGLPGMNGYDVANRIRTIPVVKEATLAALTGWGQEEDRRRSKEAGFDYHLVKPVATEELDRILAAAMSQSNRLTSHA